MIQPNELRLGSIVFLKNSGIVTLDEDQLETIFGGRHYAIFDPIPLTEEWLIVLGFRNVTKSPLDQIDNYETWMSKFEVVKIAKVCLVGKDNMGTDVCYAYPRQSFAHWSPIRHVYQLQNLYFALTGKELELKKETA